MSQSINRNAWPRGINNKVRKDRLPEGAVREAINLDPTPDGGLSLRTAAEEVYGAGAVTAVWKHGNVLLLHEGTDLVWMNPATSETRNLGTIGTDKFDHAYFDRRSYLASQGDIFVVGSDDTLYPWGAPQGIDPVVSLTSGSLLPGIYKVTTTFTVPFEGGELEGGAALPQVIDVPEGSALSVTLPAPPAGGSVNLYVSEANGLITYLQNSLGAGGTVSVQSVAVESESVPEEPREPMPVGRRVAEHRGMLAVADEDVLYVSDPMNPFVFTPTRSTYRFPGDIRFLIGDDTGFIVGHAHGVSLLSDVETDQPSLRTLDELPPVEGSGHKTRTGEVYWVTTHGLHRYTPQGTSAPITQDFTPDNMSSCTLGGFDYNGYERIVINPTGNSKANGLVACDYYTARVVKPEDQ